MKYARDFLFFLNIGGVPAGIGLFGLTHFKPIIEDLVAKENLKKEVLDIFK